MSAKISKVRNRDGALAVPASTKDIVGQFSYVVETERRFYLANNVDLIPHNSDGEVYFELRLADAWRGTCTASALRQASAGDHVQDVNIEEVEKPELRLPE